MNARIREVLKSKLGVESVWVEDGHVFTKDSIVHSDNVTPQKYVRLKCACCDYDYARMQVSVKDFNLMFGTRLSIYGFINLNHNYSPRVYTCIASSKKKAVLIMKDYQKQHNASAPNSNYTVNFNFEPAIITEIKPGELDLDF